MAKPSKFLKIRRNYPWKYRHDKDKRTYTWMINDLYRGLQTKSNYLVALGLLAYSEAIGWAHLGKPDHKKPLPTKEKDIKGTRSINFWCFDEFTKKFVGIENITDTTYDTIRNGLAHRYYGKTPLAINTISSDGDEPIFQEIGSDVITINLDKYFKKFVAGVEKLMDEQHEKPLTALDNTDGPKGLPLDSDFGKGNTLGASGPSKAV